MRKIFVFIGCFLVFFASCKKDKEQAPANYITADIDGKPVKFTVNNLARSTNATVTENFKLYLYGAAGWDENSDAISINISEPQEIKKGTYTGGIDDTRYVAIAYLTGPFSSEKPNEYVSDLSDGGMAVTITSISKDNIQGTFRGTLLNTNNGTQKTLTNGKFNLSFNY